MQNNGFYPSDNTGGAVENDESYYYYYMMPDGTYGYAQAGGGYDANTNNNNNNNAGMTADSGGNLYSPTEEMGCERPTGYEEPIYGTGTGYNNNNNNTAMNRLHPSVCNSNSRGAAAHEQPPQQYYYDANTGCYYYYDTSGATGDAAGAAAASPDASAAEVGGAASPADAGAAQPPTLQPAGSFLYVPPVSFSEMKKFRGSNQWVVSGCGACPHRPCYCIGACLCPWCLVGAQRKRLLLNDWSNYLCCAGTCGRIHCCCERRRHGCCQLCCELTFCLPCALRGNRAILMKHYSLKPTDCDHCINSFSCVCEIFHCCAKWSPSCCGWLYCCALPCLLAQQEEQRVKLQYPANSAMV